MTTESSPNPINAQHYRSLPATMFSADPMMLSPQPQLIRLNQALLDQYGLSSDWFEQQEALTLLSGNIANTKNQPIAMAYSGHQFGNWVPVLGDGRAHMLGQITDANGELIDVQTKGSGRTRFSRGGDGRATLESVLREYLISEAMAGLNIPTTRSLAMITTGEKVMRQELSPGAILVRTGRSHLRVGSFQYAAATGDTEVVRALADFAIDHQFKSVIDSTDRYRSLLQVTIERQALLISKWMLAGFIHGVMNTDNVSIIGETIDFGPCAFMDEFKANKVFSSIDRHGRYAWSQQPQIAIWNLTRFAETLLPLLDTSTDKAVERATECLEQFSPIFSNHFNSGLLKKIGLHDSHDEKLISFANQTLAMLEQHEMDFTLFFDRLTTLVDNDDTASLLDVFPIQEIGHEFINEWRVLHRDHACSSDQMRAHNPMVIARNHQVEKALEDAARNNDYGLFERLCAALKSPFSLDAKNLDLQSPPRVDQRVRETFCGT